MPVIDSQLTHLLDKEKEPDALPLALRRFAATFREPSPTVAMRMAVDRLLDTYFDGRERCSPVRVARLGRLVGAHVVVPVELAPAENVYSAGVPKVRRAYTGCLVFKADQPHIAVPPRVDRATARLSVAHEIGHLLVHRRDEKWDRATLRLPTTSEEEALAEYGARLLLMPSHQESRSCGSENLAESALQNAHKWDVTVHASVARLGDPDREMSFLRGAILWRMNTRAPRGAPIAERLTPQWHLCPRAFVPVGKCVARIGSLTADLAARPGPASDFCTEDVRIGSFVGHFVAHGYAWGDVTDGTRLVLTVFLDPEAGSPQGNGVADGQTLF